MSLPLLLDGPRGLARGVWGEWFAPAELVLIGWFLRGRGLLAKDCHDVFDRYDIELVIGLKIHGDSVFGVKDNFVVLSKGHVLVVFDLARDRNDSAGDRWDFGCIGQGDSSLGLPFGLVLKDQDSGSDGFNGFEGVFLGHNGFKGGTPEDPSGNEPLLLWSKTRFAQKGNMETWNFLDLQLRIKSSYSEAQIGRYFRGFSSPFAK